MHRRLQALGSLQESVQKLPVLRTQILNKRAIVGLHLLEQLSLDIQKMTQTRLASQVGGAFIPFER